MHWLLSSAFPHKYVRWKCYIVVCAQFLRYVVMHKVCFPSRQPQPTMDHYGLQNNGGIMRRPCGVRSQKGMWNTILVWCTEFFFAWRNHYFRNIAFFLRFGSDFLVFFWWDAVQDWKITNSLWQTSRHPHETTLKGRNSTKLCIIKHVFNIRI